MNILLLILAVAAFAALFGCLSILVWFNWGTAVRATTISAIIGGMTTILVATLSGLKETNISDTFAIAVAVDDSTGLPIPETRTFAHPVFSNSTLWFQARGFNRDVLPKTADDQFALVGELLQFAFLEHMSLMGLEKISASSAGDFSASASALRRPSDAVKFPFDQVDDQNGNRFLMLRVSQLKAAGKGFMQDVRVPKGTEVHTRFQKGSVETGGDKYILALKKPGFFEFSIVAEALGASAQIKGSKKIAFTVRMTGKLDWISAGGFKRAEYETWINWVFGEIKKDLSAAFG